MTEAGEKFLAWHRGELAKMAVTLVRAAGGQIAVTSAIMQDTPECELIVTEDHATGSIIYSVTEEEKAA